MANIIDRAFQKIDKVMEETANNAVRAYNWTTGRTKRDLANNMQVLAVIPESAGSFLDGKSYSLAMLPWSLFTTALFCKRNDEQNELEERAKNKMTLDGYVDKVIKPENKAGSYAYGAFSLLIGGTCPISGILYQSLGCSLGFGLRSASFYVMNADDLPPRKNCIQRGIESIIETYKSAAAQPSLSF